MQEGLSHWINCSKKNSSLGKYIILMTIARPMSKAVTGRANARIKSEIDQVTEGKEIGAPIKHTGIEKQASLLPVFDLTKLGLPKSMSRYIQKITADNFHHSSLIMYSSTNQPGSQSKSKLIQNRNIYQNFKIARFRKKSKNRTLLSLKKESFHKQFLEGLLIK